MARFKTADLRRIVREEIDQASLIQTLKDEQFKRMGPDTHKTWERLRSGTIPIKIGKEGSSDPLASEIDWRSVVDQVLSAYWEVVEEEVNE